MEMTSILRFRLVVVVLMSLGLGMLLPTAAFCDVTIEGVGTLGGSFSSAQDINDSGQVAGYSSTGKANRAFLWNSGKMQDLGTLGGGQSYAFGINDSEQVVGYSSTGKANHAFRWDRNTIGGMKDLGTLGGGDSYAYAINDSGQVVGYSSTGKANRAFLWNSGKMQDLGTLGGSYSYAYDINNSGQVVGYSNTASGDHAFLRNSGKMQDLGTLGGKNSEAFGINDSGQVVGRSETGKAIHAFLRNSGKMQDLGTLGGKNSEAFGINDSGQVVGYSNTASGNHAFLWDSEDGMQDLQDLLPAGSGWTALLEGRGINDSGQIAGLGIHDGQKQGFVMTLGSSEITVALDIKPGSDPNSINPGSRGRIPVAILSDASFDASTEVNQASLTFGRTGDEPTLSHCNPEDVDADGDLDLVCHFNTQGTAFQEGDTEGTLKGETNDEVALSGTDSVRIVPPKGKKGGGDSGGGA